MNEIVNRLEDCVYEAMLKCLRLDSINHYLLKHNEISRCEYETIARNIENSYWTKYDQLKSLVELFKNDMPFIMINPALKDRVK